MKLYTFLKTTAADVQLRIKRYQEAITHCRPAMRFWFFETQRSPQKWYEMRLNFTRSAATTSIVGHILGLGDRHLSNILIDQVTGEVVQIDLGIAFDGVRNSIRLFYSPEPWLILNSPLQSLGKIIANTWNRTISTHPRHGWWIRSGQNWRRI